MFLYFLSFLLGLLIVFIIAAIFWTILFCIFYKRSKLFRDFFDQVIWVNDLKTA